jgi:hypothetical protein
VCILAVVARRGSNMKIWHTAPSILSEATLRAVEGAVSRDATAVACEGSLPSTVRPGAALIRLVRARYALILKPLFRRRAPPDGLAGLGHAVSAGYVFVLAGWSRRMLRPAARGGVV